MDFHSILFVLIGSTVGLTLRLFIKYRLKIGVRFYINKISLVNILASLFLGILVSLGLTNRDLFLLFYVGFLGCFSTFSSFIYNLFLLLKRRRYIEFLLHYIGVTLLSFLFFYIGYYSFKSL